MTLPKFTVICLDIKVLDSFNRVLRSEEALVDIQRNTNIASACYDRVSTAM